MNTEKDMIDKLETSRASELALELKKALCGLKQVRRSWSELLHKKLKRLGFSSA